MAIPTLAMIPSGYKAGKLYSVLPSDGTGDFTVARNSKATRVNQSGLIEEVDVNVPRLDYSAGGCPVLLTEIESQNIITYSEDFSNASWTKYQTSVSANSSISPDGTLNADLLQETTVNNYFSCRQVLTVTSGQKYTFSFFAKKKDYDYIQYSRSGDGGSYANFNISNGTLGNNSGSDILNHQIEYYVNGWYRCIVSINAASTSSGFGITLLQNNVASRFETYLGDGSSGTYIYGAQVEQQPAATSYIKSNSGSATTREADFVDGAGSAATFNSLEHTLFVDLNSVFESGVTSDISILGSTGTVTDNRILIFKEINNTQIQFQVRSGGATIATEILSNIDFSVRQKLAITLKENEVKYYRNGFLVATDTGTLPLPVSLGQLTLNDREGSSGDKFFASTKDIRYYNQVLTEAETLELMSYDSFNEMASALQYTIK